MFSLLTVMAILLTPQASMIAFATRTDSAITLDGSLNEAAWAAARPIGELVQREPKEGEMPTERTDVEILYDNDNLYVGIVCYDSQPDRIIGTQMARDADLEGDDKIEILIDTFRDQRNAFYFATNPAGALVDGLIIENGQFNKDWDTIWNVRVRKSDIGWVAEFAIPFKSLTFRQGEASWGFNISRSIKRKLEEDRWAAPRLNIPFFQVSEEGEISGIDGLERSRGLDVRPFLSGRSTNNPGPPKTNWDGKGGLDAFYKLTPNLRVALTANTDFAETEVDNRQINLTRFPLFFPEKRSFFLENAGVFSFSNISADVIPFFSRNIGLNDGQEIPISSGIKLTGKTARYDIGVLDVNTRHAAGVDSRNFLVTRLKRTILQQSYIGGTFSVGDPTGRTSGKTYGTDLRLGTSHFVGTQRTVYFDSYALKAANVQDDKRNNSFGLGVTVPGDLWNVEADWKQIDGNFNPALGFVPRSNIRKFNFISAFAPRPKHYLSVRQMLYEFRFNRYTRIDKGQTESWRLFTAPLNYVMNSGDVFEFNYAPQFERLFAPFAFPGGVVLPPGDYSFTRWRVQYKGASKRPLKFDAIWWFGTYWSGHANEVTTSLQFKLAPHFQTTLTLNETFARLKEGSFVARILTLQANYSFSAMITLFNLVQFDNETRNLGWQSRVRWIARPGNEIFFVFNQGWLQDERNGFKLHQDGRSIASKIQYTFRF